MTSEKSMRDRLRRMHAALGEIDYIVGEPNDMECSVYDVFPSEGGVVKRVQAAIASRNERIARLVSAATRALDAAVPLEALRLSAGDELAAEVKHAVADGVDALRSLRDALLEERLLS